MANTKISALTANTNPNGSEEFVYAYNNANGKITLNTMKTYTNTGQQAALVSGVNIKTINNESILGSGNIDVSGGGGGGGVTELGGDANIWELAEGEYITTYDLYYKSGEKVPRHSGTGATNKMRLSVISESGGERGYFVYNVGHRNTSYDSYLGFGYSISSSTGLFNDVRKWDAAIRGTLYSYTGELDAFTSNTFTHVVTDFRDVSSSLRISGNIYGGMIYNVYVASYDTGESANITLGTGVTNPLNIVLPTNCTKPFHISLLATSTTTAIVTGCTIQA